MPHDRKYVYQAMKSLETVALLILVQYLHNLTSSLSN